MADPCVCVCVCPAPAMWRRHHGLWTVAPPGQSELHRGPQ